MNGSSTDWVGLLHRLAPLLPAGLFERVRAFPSPAELAVERERDVADCLKQAIAALDSLRHTLTNFVPRYLLDLSPTPGEPHGELLEGSFIFADVTGFTALTGELSKRGTEGREEMNRLMRALFAAILDPLLNSGGDLLIFAGDAALALFPAQPEGRDARWATRTALRLVEAITPFAEFQTPYGSFSLTMSAGVERGLAFAAVVGTRRRMELLVSGGPVQGATQAEGQAEPGQVAVGPGVLPFLRPDEFILRGNIVEGIQGGELSDYEPVPPARRRSRISAIVSRQLPDLLEHLDKVLRPVEALVPFIPPDLFAQIARREDVRQHPPVAVQFVNVMGLEEMALGAAGPQKAAAVFQRYFVQAQEVVSDREGIVSQVDAYAKGFTLLNPFGAPTHHEGVPRLAASAALELARVLERVNREFDLDPPLAQRIGLTYDRIFTGEIGYQHRREYVVAGPAVNLAARLMSKSEPGQIVLDPLAWQAVQGDFISDALDPIPLKGIPEPVPRFALRGLRRGKGLNLADYPLAGRREEQAMLEERLGQAAAGRGGAVALIGEAGIGKSRLLAAVADAARRRGFAVLLSRCQPFARTTPYLPWADLVAEWFGFDEEMALDARRRGLRERLAGLGLGASFPAFADLLGLPPVQLASRTDRERTPQKPGLFDALKGQTVGARASDSSGLAARLTERVALAESLRTEGEEMAGPSIWQILRERASIPEALQLLLERLTARQPVLVLIEDLQWMDLDSRNVLDALVKAAEGWPLLLVVTARPEGDWAGDRILLSPLSDDESRDLAAFALRATALEPDLAEWLLHRVKGNPLFVLAYCRALRDSAAVVVDPASDTAHWSGPPPALPLSLQELLLAQVEQLDQETKESMRRGAVVGPAFPTWLLDQLCRGLLPAAQLEGALDQAARRDVVAPPPPGKVHAFSSQSLHDAIYGTLSHALRREWHGRVGDILAEADPATRYERLEQIAYHYGRGDDASKAAHFNRLAGDKARARQADEAALAFYEQVLATSGGEEVVDEQRWAREGIGDVRALRDEVEAAYAAYQSAAQDAPPGNLARLRAKMALVSPLINQDGARLLERVRQELDPADALQPWLGAALCWVYAGQGEVDAAGDVCRSVLAGPGGEPIQNLLQEGLNRLEAGDPLPAYADLFALFAGSYLRLFAGGEG